MKLIFKLKKLKEAIKKLISSYIRYKILEFIFS